MLTRDQRVIFVLYSMSSSLLKYYERGSMTKSGNKIVVIMRKELNKLHLHRPLDCVFIGTQIDILWNHIADKHKGKKLEGMTFVIQLLNTQSEKVLKKYGIRMSLLESFSMYESGMNETYEDQSITMANELIKGAELIIDEKITPERNLDLENMVNKIRKKNKTMKPMIEEEEEGEAYVSESSKDFKSRMKSTREKDDKRKSKKHKEYQVYKKRKEAENGIQK